MVYIKAPAFFKNNDLLGSITFSILWLLLVLILLGARAKAEPLNEAAVNITKQTPADVTTPAPSNSTSQPAANTSTQSPANSTTQAPVNATTQSPTNSTTEGQTDSSANTTKQTPDSLINSDPALWKGKTVLLDAGHGGHDPGAVRLGIREKDITLRIVLHLRKVLKARGAKVIVTREDDKVDLELSDISAIVTKVNPDVFISIHVNSSVAQSSSGGLQTYFMENCSRMLAHTMHSVLLQQLKATDKGIFTRNFWVLNNPNVPSLLIETGYITNRPDRRNLITPSYQHKFCVAIANGLELYWAKKKLGLKN
ncbi:MAG: N-acetylmuramoyl-L-alanine amidase [Candidatus Obscuribacterales bacterium]|nr:N-acetylmuramoyl-L-alanine amidase [Candidatus Obscuribacterales bacterium]